MESLCPGNLHFTDSFFSEIPQNLFVNCNIFLSLDYFARIKCFPETRTADEQNAQKIFRYKVQNG